MYYTQEFKYLYFRNLRGYIIQKAVICGVEMSLDHRIFCEILVQRPVARSTIYLPSQMTAEDLEYMRVMAQQHFDKIMAVLKDMPRPMLLIIR